MISNFTPSHNIVFIIQFKALVLTIRLEFHLIGMHTWDCTYCLVCEKSFQAMIVLTENLVTTRKCTAAIV